MIPLTKINSGLPTICLVAKASKTGAFLMQFQALRSARLIALLIGLCYLASGPSAAKAQDQVSSYYTSPGNYGTSYGQAGYGAVRTHSDFPSPGYGHSMRQYAVKQNQWGSGIWLQPGANALMPASYQIPYQTWAVPSRSGVQSNQPLPPIGSYAPTLGPGYGLRRASAY